MQWYSVEWYGWVVGWLILRFIFTDEHTYRYQSYSYADYWMNMKVKWKLSNSEVFISRSSIETKNHMKSISLIVNLWGSNCEVF